MNSRIWSSIVLVALLLISSTLPLTQADGNDTSGRQAGPDVVVGDFHDFDVAITELTERWSIPGTQVAVMFNGTLVFSSGYGVADSESATNVTNDSKFRIA
ncbi:MAG: hypothetical protein CXX80_01550, partial [Methanobacteriota archaeon]